MPEKFKNTRFLPLMLSKGLIVDEDIACFASDPRQPIGEVVSSDDFMGKSVTYLITDAIVPQQQLYVTSFSVMAV